MAGDGTITRRELLQLMGAGMLGGALPATGQAAADAHEVVATNSQGFADGMLSASATTIAYAIREGMTTSTEVTRHYLERIEAINPRLNAIVLVTAEQALEQAARADAALARQGATGPLHGVPMTLKDSIDTAGVVTTYGTAGRVAAVPKADATVARRLREAGAILIGKTNTPELTLSFETDNDVFGRTMNPFDSERSPGGSSGGAAAAVSSGLCAFDIGSDTGGSIRVPSHCCGTVGLKPTQGRVPRTGHAIGYGGLHDGLTQLGPIARSVDDLELILRVIAGPDGRDPFVSAAPLRDSREVDVAALRVAWHSDNGIFTPTGAIRSVTEAAARSLEEAGAALTEIVPPPIPDTNRALLKLFVWNVDGGAWIRRLLDDAGTENPSPAIAAQINPDLRHGADVIVERIEARDRFRAAMVAFMADYDVLVTPVTGFPAPPYGQAEDNAHFAGYSYTQVCNLAGLPAAVVRCGTSPEGLPIGVQIAAPPWREDLALSVARHLEAEFGGWQAPPLQS
jgi:amidase